MNSLKLELLNICYKDTWEKFVLSVDTDLQTECHDMTSLRVSGRENCDDAKTIRNYLEVCTTIMYPIDRD